MFGTSRCLLLIAMLAPQFTGAAEDSAREEGFSPLCNGKDLTGWVKEGAAGFSIKDGIVACDGTGDYPTWLRSEKVYENFVLRFDFKLGKYDESGVFLHAPLHGRNCNVGFEVQLSDETRNFKPFVQSSGAIFGILPPLKHASKPLNEWNSVEVVFDWPKLKVTLNGVVVQDLDVEEHESLRYRLRSGFLGLQDRAGEVYFRNLRIKELPAKEKWKRLFNGKNFAGWHFHDDPPAASWKVVDGEILAENGNGYLLTDEEYQDCEFQCYIRGSHHVNGGVFFRWKERSNRGFEVQIEDIPDSNNPTGSIYDFARASHLPIAPGQWYLLQVRVHGKNVLTRVNGETVAQFDNMVVRPGNIGLQMHKREGWIRFKDLKIKAID